jgi:hypothetical protein
MLETGGSNGVYGGWGIRAHHLPGDAIRLLF